MVINSTIINKTNNDLSSELNLLNLYHNIWRLKSSSWLGTVTIHVQAKRLFNVHSFIFVRWFDRLKHSHIHISKDVVLILPTTVYVRSCTKTCIPYLPNRSGVRRLCSSTGSDWTVNVKIVNERELVSWRHTHNVVSHKVLYSIC